MLIGFNSDTRSAMHSSPREEKACFLGSLYPMGNTSLDTSGDTSAEKLFQQFSRSEGLGISRVAFVGRSNAGKSTLINTILGQTLARVSKTPGKTRAVHFFMAREYAKILVDLPGYGYARVSKSEQDSWAQLIESYLRMDRKLKEVLVLVDARLGITELDENAIRFIGSKGIRIGLLYCKVDKLKSQRERAARRHFAQQQIQQFGYSNTIGMFWISSHSREGLSDLKKHLKKEV